MLTQGWSLGTSACPHHPLLLTWSFCFHRTSALTLTHQRREGRRLYTKAPCASYILPWFVAERIPKCGRGLSKRSAILTKPVGGGDALVTKSSLTLETPQTVARQAPLPLESPGKNTGAGCHFLLQGIFLTQGLNPSLLHCRQFLYRLSNEATVNKTHPQCLDGATSALHEIEGLKLPQKFRMMVQVNDKMIIFFLLTNEKNSPYSVFTFSKLQSQANTMKYHLQFSSKTSSLML